jgi:zinc protease
MDEDFNELKQVTPENIQHAAQTYLTRQRLSIAQVLVETSDE